MNQTGITTDAVSNQPALTDWALELRSMAATFPSDHLILRLAECPRGAAARHVHLQQATCIEWHDIGISESFCKIILRTFGLISQPVNVDGFLPLRAAAHRKRSMKACSAVMAPRLRNRYEFRCDRSTMPVTAGGCRPRTTDVTISNRFELLRLPLRPPPRPAAVSSVRPKIKGWRREWISADRIRLKEIVGTM